MREAVGDDIDIMVDCHARPSPRDGPAASPRRSSRTASTGSKSRAGRRRVDGIAAIQRAGRARRSPPASGWSAQHAFRELLEKRACSVFQPDITHCGGLTEARRIAALAEAYRVALAPHNPQGPVSTAASLEFGFATPTLHHLRNGPRRRALAAGRRQRRLHRREEGPHRAARAPRPGLGIEINEAEVKKHPFQQEVLQRSFYADGSVGDW